MNEQNKTASELKLEGLINTINRLSEIIAKENDALKEHKLEVVSETLRDKESLARLYIEMIRGVAANPAYVASLPEEKRNSLKSLALALEEKMRLNQSLLKANMNANEKMIQIVVKSAQQQKQNEAHSYSACGVLGDNKGHNKDNAFAFNETL